MKNAWLWIVGGVGLWLVTRHLDLRTSPDKLKVAPNIGRKVDPATWGGRVRVTAGQGTTGHTHKAQDRDRDAWESGRVWIVDLPDVEHRQHGHWIELSPVELDKLRSGYEIVTATNVGGQKDAIPHSAGNMLPEMPAHKHPVKITPIR